MARSLKPLIGGLGMGVLAGAVLLIIKWFIAQQLIVLLDDMAQASCENCHFRIDSIEFSLSSLKAKGTNARIEQGGVPKFQFNALTAEFSLRHYEKNIALLENLTLADGRADGIGPGTVAFRFIDFLTSPPRPDRAIKSSWHLKLLSLSVLNTTITEPLKNGSILCGEKVNVFLSRNSDDTFSLQPTASRLYISTLKNTIYELGKLHGHVLISHGVVNLQPIVLTPDNSEISISGAIATHEHTTVDAKVNGKLNMTDIPVRGIMSGAVELQGKLTGLLASPSLDISFSPDPHNPILPTLLPALPQLTNGRGSAHITFSPEATLTLANTQLTGPETSLSATAPLFISSESMSGNFAYSANSAKLYGSTAHSLTAKVALSGLPAEPAADFTLTIPQWDVGPVTLHPQSIGGQFKGDTLLLQIQEKQSLQDLSINLQLDQLTSPKPFLRAGEIFLANWPLVQGSQAAIQLPQRFADLKLKAFGPLSVKEIKGDLSVVIRDAAPEKQPLITSNLKLAEGVFSGKISNPAGSLNGSVLIDTAKPSESSIHMTLEEFTPAIYDPELQCISISLDADYRGGEKLIDGNGQINLKKASFGCAPYTTSLEKPATIAVQAGKLSLPGLTWHGQNSLLKTTGSVGISSGYDIGLVGTIRGDSLVSLLPNFDDLHGKLDLDARIAGPVLAPDFSGRMKVQEGGFAIESAQLMGSELSGELEISGDHILLNKLTGEMNGGEIQLSGEVFPLDFTRSDFKLVASNIQLSPAQGTEVTIDADLTLTPRRGAEPLLAGTLNLVSGDIQRNLDLKAIISALTRYLLSNKESKASLSRLPAAELDLKVHASRGLFIDATIFAAEFAANLEVRGQLNDPAISGTIDALSGWIAIKDARFDVTNGQITFSPDRESPEIRVLAETNFRTREGENVTTFLEVNGELFNPKVRLSSDYGFSESQLLALLTAGTDFGRRTLLNAPGYDSATGKLSTEIERGLSLSSLLKRLTTIDVLTIEPQLNTRTGEVEPALFARKNLSERMSLIAQSSLGQSLGTARAGVTFDLTSSLNATALIDSASSSESAAVGVDLVTTLLARQRDFLKIKVKGNSQISKRKLLQAIRVGANSRIQASEIPQLERAIRQFLIGQGLLAPQGAVSCKVVNGLCRQMEIKIAEGALSKIAVVHLAGLEDRLRNLVLPRLPQAGQTASEDTRFNAARVVIQLLRNEGYISAQVRAQYVQENSSSPDVSLDIRVTPGNPVSFVFVGNKHFSAEEFLATIKLFSRTQPFGANTINILVANIERLYREAGYLLVTIGVDDTTTIEGRKIYTLNINEETKVSVRQVSFTGFNSFSEKNFRARAASLSGERYNQIFSPAVVLSESIEENIQVIASILIEEGYPTPTITYEILPISDNYADGVTIHYIVDEGKAFRAESVSTSGLPDSLKFGSKEQPPYSVPKINRMVSELFELLKGNGYLQAVVHSSVNAGSLELLAEPGEQSKVGTISVAGNSKVASDAIFAALTFKSGDRLTLASLEKSRSNLLQQGLFTRVSIESSDGREFHGGVQDLTIQVTERPLTTLELGVGVNSEDGLHVIAEASDRSLFADGKTLSIQADSYFSQTDGSVTRGGGGFRYVDPRLLDSDLRYSEDLRFQKVETSTYEFDAQRITLSTLLYKLSEGRSPFTFGHSLVWEKISNVPSDVVLSDLDEGSVRLSYLQFSATRDNRDDPLLPRSGWFAGLEGKFASEAIASDANFVSAVGRVSMIRSLKNRFDRFSIAEGIKVGFSSSFGGSPDTPISQRYYIGGRSTVRGFKENSLGPRGGEGHVIGGDTMAVNNLELRYSFDNNVALHAFYDMGLLALDRAISFNDVRESTGLGLYYLSPIGPIGFDLGFPIDKKAEEARMRLHFSIGTNY